MSWAKDGGGGGEVGCVCGGRASSWVVTWRGVCAVCLSHGVQDPSEAGEGAAHSGAGVVAEARAALEAGVPEAEGRVHLPWRSRWKNWMQTWNRTMRKRCRRIKGVQGGSGRERIRGVAPWSEFGYQ
jgi:hypothetical protein